MSHSSIPVDVFNPGQVLACVGLVELSIAIHGSARGGFDWCDPSGELFHLVVDGSSTPVRDALEFVVAAKLSSFRPAGCDATTEDRDVQTDTCAAGAPFPVPTPPTRATLPARLEWYGASVSIDYWADGTRRDNFKLWGGAGGYPGAALLRDAIDLVRRRVDEAEVDPFAFAAPQSSSFRLDWRRDYIPIDAGFSPNAHGDIVLRGHPWVEILGAIGLGSVRPRREAKLRYHYGIIGRASGRPLEDAFVHPALLRAAVGATPLGAFSQRHFVMELGWPGQEGQARSITHVSEEPCR